MKPLLLFSFWILQVFASSQPRTDCTLSENLDKEWIDGGFVRACKVIEVVDTAYHFMTLQVRAEIAFRCITHEGYQIVVEEEKRLADGSVYDCMRVNLTEAELIKLTPEEAALPRKCENGKRVNETWEDIESERVCHVDSSGKATVVVTACAAYEMDSENFTEKRYRIAVGEMRGLEKCVATEDGQAKIEKIAPGCINGKKLNEEWEEEGFLKACVLDPKSVSAVIVIKACTYEGVVIPVGEERKVPQGSCQCVAEPEQTSEGAEQSLVLDASVQCKGTGVEMEMERPDCSEPENVKKEWVEGRFVRACKAIESADHFSHYLDFVEIAFKCITPYGDHIVIEEEKALANGSVYDCVRVNKTEAELVLLSPQDAQLPRKCENGKRIKETWDDQDFQKACRIVAGKATVEVIACFSTGWTGYRYRIEVGSSMGKPEDGQQRCVRLDGGLAKLEKHRPICTNGKNLGDQWEGRFFIKACELERDIADAELAIIVVKSCVINRDVIPVDQQVTHDVNGVVSRCECIRSDNRENRFGFNQTTAATLSCLPVFPSEENKKGFVRTSSICDNYSNIGDEWKEDKRLKKCEPNPDDVENAVSVVTGCLVEDVTIPLGDTVGVFFKSEGIRARCRCDPSKRNAHNQTIEAAVHCSFLDADSDVPICENGKRLGDVWNEPNRAKKCELDAATGQDAIIVVTACFIDTAVIPVGERGAVFYKKSGVNATCLCKRTDGRGNGQQVLSAMMDCVQLTPYEIPRTQTVPATTTEIPATGLDCQNPENWKKEVVIGSFVRTCDLIEDPEHPASRYDFNIVEVTVQCITPSGDWIKVEEEKRLEDGTAYDCVRVNTTEAKLVLLTPIEASLPRKCSNGRRVNTTWIEKELELTCQFNSMRVPSISVLSCILPYPMANTIIRIPLGETRSTGGSGLSKCVPTEDGLAKQEYVVPFCENGRNRGEEWTEDPFIKACESDGVADADGVLVVVRACVVDGIAIPVGEERKMNDYAESTCRCEGKRADYGITDAGIFCEGVGPNPPVRPMTLPVKTTPKPANPARPNCKDVKNLNKEVIDGKFVKACKNVTFYKKRAIRYMTLRCITPEGDQVRVGKTKSTATGTFTCKQLPYGMANLVFVKNPTTPTPQSTYPAPTCDSGLRLGEIEAKDRFLKKCMIIEGDLLSEVTIGCVTLKETRMLEGEVLEEDDYHISCKRDEDGKMQMHYSFTLTEKSETYHNHPH